MSSIITLTTDFGLEDEYVGVMKGVILSLAPAVKLVDLTHNINSQAVQDVAFLIKAAYDYFPKGTVHLIVVDPGVGGERKIITLCADGHTFVAPDNGSLTMLLSSRKFESAYAVTNSDFFMNPVCSTFHGRDIMAPVAARLASGLAPGSVGPAMERADLIRLPLPEAFVDQEHQTISGEIISIDKFGNLITNIHADDIRSLYDAKTPSLFISINGQIITGLHHSYEAVKIQHPVAVIGSRNYLEVGVNQGHAANFFEADYRDAVTIFIEADDANPTNSDRTNHDQ
jgi:S-adenosylmethionine hydrolase